MASTSPLYGISDEILFLSIADSNDTCSEPLGMEDKRIADDQITASSVWSFNKPSDHGTSNGRLNRPSQTGSVGAWCGERQERDQWIQVDLMIPAWVTGVMIQGREDSAAWVTKYKVEYSSDGQNWVYVQANGDDEGMVNKIK